MEFQLPGGPPALKQAIERHLRQKLSFIWRLWTSPTAELPTASADNEGALVYDETLDRLAVSANSAWVTLQPYDATLAALALLDSSAGILVQTAADTFAKRTLQAPAAGITITNPAGTAGNPTFALANDLAALEGLSSTGFAARTTTDTWAQRTLQAPAAGLTISNPAGVAGDPTFALANDLSALEGLSSTGLAARTGTDAWAQRTITGPAAGITVSNGSGASGNPTLALANDLAALEALSGTNTIYYRSGTDTWAAVTIGGLLSFSGGALNIGSTTGTGSTVVLSASPTLTGTSTFNTTSASANAVTIQASGVTSRTFGLGVNASAGFDITDNSAGLSRLNITGGGNFGFNGASYGGGTFVLFIANASVVPSTNPTGGGVLYADAGALKWRGSGGTVTTIAAA